MRKLSASIWLVFLILGYYLFDPNKAVFGQETRVGRSEPDSHLERGLDLLNHGRFFEASNELTAALEITPDSLTALAHRSKTYILTGQTSKALEDINRAIQLSPSNPELHKLRGDILSTSGDYRNAVSDYDRAIGLAPAMASAYNNRAVALANMNRNKEAVEDLNTAMDIAVAAPSSGSPAMFQGSKW